MTEFKGKFKTTNSFNHDRKGLEASRLHRADGPEVGKRGQGPAKEARVGRRGVRPTQGTEGEVPVAPVRPPARHKGSLAGRAPPPPPWRLRWPMSLESGPSRVPPGTPGP